MTDRTSSGATAPDDLDREGSRPESPVEIPSRVVELSVACSVDAVTHCAVPVLVVFWAPWCRPCRVLAPIIERLAAAHAGTLNVGTINIDEQPMLAGLAGVNRIPFLLMFRDGRPVRHVIGVRSQPELEETLGLGRQTGWSD